MGGSVFAFRNDQVVQDAAYNLFKGYAPERSSEIDQFWAVIRPIFNGNCYEFCRS
jgi:hypothetical protein